MLYFVRFILVLLIGTVVTAQTETTTITVEVLNIDSNKGQLLIGLYDSADDWLKNDYKGEFGKIVDGKCTIVFEDIPTGIYGVSLFHDENDNGKLDTNFLGIPKEDTGSSNNAPANFGPPKWEDAKFEVKGGAIKQIINL